MIPAVSRARLLARVEELGAVGRTAAGGVTRLAYSGPDVAGRDLVAGWGRGAGLAVEVDAACNLVGRRRGDGSGLGVLATGSHLDSVVDAGRLDGAYGAVAAFECATALHEAGVVLRHDLAVVGFSNEEGARGTPGMVGSLAIAGHPLDLDRPDDEGVRLGDRLSAAGGDGDAVASAAWAPGSVAAFLELHIEQGPVLERAAATIGVVEGITARANVELLVTGHPRHAGTTPMDRRRDALAAAARLVLAVEELATSGAVRVATAGRLDVDPGVRNVVPGAATVSVDVRDADETRLELAIVELGHRAADIARRTGCGIELRRGPQVAAVPTDEGLRALIASAAKDRGFATLQLPSGAGHDAQVMAALGPVGMIFVPSKDGVSHAASEGTSPDDLVAGAEVLLHALLATDAALP